MRGRKSDASTTRPEAGSSPGDALARVRQIVVVGAARREDAGVFTLRRETLFIGRRAAGARSLVLEDEEASRSHAVLEYDDAEDVWSLVDQESRNGTFVDGVRVASAKLRHGSVIRIGCALLVFVDVELAPDMPLVAETPSLLGEGLAMMRLRGEIERVGAQSIPVLVLGETGVGKERVAEGLHAASGRTGAFVPVNCAAIPATLADNELFGHAAGAFTGATARAEGLFGAADGGTLFLDEVGELPEVVQAKSLRALATGEVRPLGRSDARRFDVRVIAATHRDVEHQVVQGTLRADFLARIAGWKLRVPSLRDHREDVLHLGEAILARGGAGFAFSTGAAEALLVHAWPCNVRELEQVLAAAAVRAGDERVIRTAHLPPEIARVVASRRPASPASRSEAPLAVLVARDRLPDAEELRVVFDRCEGNVTQVAEFFGRDRRQVYRWLERAGMDMAALRDRAPG